MSRDPFDPLTVPLEGIRLIEASAGTGKTFSLAGLYLRLLLEKQVSVREILVVTFTRAATKELRERIRQRLADAARIARDRAAATGGAENKLALDLIEACGLGHEEAARRWADAAHRMDEATITTIHGFSQRAAAENAFDSALPFDRGEQIDDRVLFREVVEDYWRARAIGANSEPSFVDWWRGPGDLESALTPLRSRPHARFAGPDDKVIEALSREVRKEWGQSGAAFSEELRSCWAAGALKSKSLKKTIEAFGGIEAALSLLDERMGLGRPILAPPLWVAHLTDAEEQFKKANLARGEALFAQKIVLLLHKLEPLARLAALRAARIDVQRMAVERKLARRQFSYADMIEALHAAVTDETTGAQLADALHRTWPWALVDEFQDTDPLQYEILRRVYAGRDSGGLILIGDPKQAIYGFRGGDVFAYLSAAADAGDTAYNLDTNFRSTPGVLKAIEAVFRSPGDDAFLVDGIKFQSVKAGRSGRREVHLRGEALPPMTLWHLAPDGTTKPVALRACQDACVAQIRELLDPESGAVVRQQDAEDKVKERPVAPRDIAVLVNTNREAAEVQRALSRVGIAAVCLHQDSVFATPEAVDLLHVLKAAASPVDEGAIRGALAGEPFGRRLSDLIALDDDEPTWQAEINRFQDMHARWRDDGVLAMLQPILQAGAERLLTYEDGERRVSNYLQLADLLAQAEGETFGMPGLLRWLRQAIQEAGHGDVADAEQLRLESDEALVRIATVHKAKGLEYPLVFLPFAPWTGSMGSADAPPFEFHDHDGQALVDIVGEDDNRPSAVRERRAEAVRVLYVALTRAELGCFLPWGAANGTPNSALASLLHREDGVGADSWEKVTSLDPLSKALTRQRLEELAERASGAIALRSMEDLRHGESRLGSDVPPLGNARTDLPAPREPWSIYSFTRLARAAEAGPAVSGARDEAEIGLSRDEEDAEHVAELPGGTDFGTAVHTLLEIVDLADWPSPAEPLPDEQLDQIESTLRRQGVPLSNPEETATTVQRTGRLICNAVHTSVGDIGALTRVPRTRRVAEMQFALRLGGARLGAVLDLLNDAGYAADLPREHQTELLRGLMHGFIDLTVEHEGRFYVIDYKTNWLGPNVDQYGMGGMRQAVRHHHYDLQYLIYVTALHRYLGRRLAGYDPGRHLGGVYYLFLRGMAPTSGQQGIYADHVDPAFVQQLSALLDVGKVEA